MILLISAKSVLEINSLKALIQAEKETIPVFTAFSEYCRQVSIINQNLIQSIWHSGSLAMHWLVRGRVPHLI